MAAVLLRPPNTLALSAVARAVSPRFAEGKQNEPADRSEWANAASLALVLLVASFVSPASAAPFLVGTWFGEGQPGDKSEMYMAHMLPNGAFRAQFRSCIKGKAYDLAQTGQWTLAGDVETITIITMNGQLHPRTDTYKVLFQNGQKQTYEYLKTGWVYNSRRVDDKFEMPSCESIS